MKSKNGRTASGMASSRRKPAARSAKTKNKAAFSPHPYLVAAARNVWRWTPERRMVAEACAIGTKQRRCAQCLEIKARKEVQIDHIVPVGKQPRSWAEYPGFYERLFCVASNLQPLCKACHEVKTNAENNARKTNKD